MKNKINTVWKENMAFEAEVNGFKIMLDADEAVGGQNLGPRPKPPLGAFSFCLKSTWITFSGFAILTPLLKTHFNSHFSIFGR